MWRCGAVVLLPDYAMGKEVSATHGFLAPSLANLGHPMVTVQYMAEWIMATVQYNMDYDDRYPQNNVL